MKESLLFLVHRIPFPPDKGDKIRSYHLLRFLAQRYRVHLGTFVDDPNDRAHLGYLSELCADICAIDISPRWQRLRSMMGIVTGDPLSLSYYRSAPLKAWVDKKLREENIERVLFFSSPMVQFVAADEPGLRRVIDFVDVDSEKWRQYAQRRSWPLSLIYRRESERLLDFEREASECADASVFVTDQEAALFTTRAPGVTGIHAVINGVDTDYFSPHRAYAQPFGEGGPVIVFTGAMDYWANVDAVDWFAKASFPYVRRQHPAARFVIVGARPSREVKRLASQPGVEVTGAVEDVRPFLSHATVSVAPMRIARGIQNKVLEALAMARPVVATSAALEGLDLPDALRADVSETALGLADKVNALIEAPPSATERVGASGRAWAQERHDWSKTLEPLARLIR